MNTEKLNALLKKYEINLTEVELTLLEIFKKEVIEKNKIFNLTSITDDEQFNIKHLLDSLIFLKYFEEENFYNKSIIDIGTGGGFPGIPLAIKLPNTKFTLVDATKKKIDFLKEVTNQLDLKNVKLKNERAETLKQLTFDYAISRGFGALSMNLEILAPLMKTNGLIILYKTPQEWEKYQNFQLFNKILLQELGIKLIDNIGYEIEGNKRIFLVFKKTKKTKKAYPRRFAEIKNNPLF